jgi:hypothetical protein
MYHPSDSPRYSPTFCLKRSIAFSVWNSYTVFANGVSQSTNYADSYLNPSFSNWLHMLRGQAQR